MGDTVRLFTKVLEPSQAHPDGGYVPVGPLNPLPISGSVSALSADRGKYEAVAASTTAVLGGAGATGDYLSGLLVTPLTTTPGNVILLDGATSMTVFLGGAGSVSNLIPFFIPVGAFSINGPWSVTTGASVTAIGVGTFT